MGNYGIDNIQHLETREAIRARVHLPNDLIFEKNRRKIKRSG